MLIAFSNEHHALDHQSVCLFSQIQLYLINYLLQSGLRRTCSNNREHFFKKFFAYRALPDIGSTGHKNVPNIVSLTYCLEQLYSCIFNSYVKACLNIWLRHMYGLKPFLLFTSCRHVYRCVCDDWQICLVLVKSLITHLQLQKMSIIYQSVHVAITFQLLEMISITTPNQTILNICTRYKFFKEKYQQFYPSA